jgi:transcriptional regulator with XRE-family HTH domain
MDSTTTRKLGEMIKEARVAKGYTQKELAELSGISIRSIQRIENGVLEARSYTLKTLCGILDIPWQTVITSPRVDVSPVVLNKQRKMILTICVPLLLILGCLAFITQLDHFPETLFELMALIFGLAMVITVFLWLLWRNA